MRSVRFGRLAVWGLVFSLALISASALVSGPDVAAAEAVDAGGMAAGETVAMSTVGTVNTNNFYFDDFTGDYYLSKDAEGVSHLKVVERVTAVFPDYEQNKGICRQIPFTNQNGKNVTLPDLNRSNLKLTRNGVSEPIYSINKSGDYYNVCTGTEEYVLGEQTYVFEYEFEKVVTDFGSYQELYWDTNGNGAMQTFSKVTARVHFDGDAAEAYAGRQWCYVGTYGKSGQERCTITTMDDGVEFSAKSLLSYENLTFDVELLPGSFVVPEPEYDYTFVWVLVGLVVVCGLSLIYPVRKLLAEREKARYYKDFFVKPEYQPDARYSLPEMAEIYIGKKKDAKVAMLLNLIVQKKVTIIKGEKWKLRVESLDGVRMESEDLLRILNGGGKVKVGDEITVEKHVASSQLEALGDDLKRKVVQDLKSDGLAESGYRFGRGNGVGGSILLTVVMFIIMLQIFGTVVMGMLTLMVTSVFGTGGVGSVMVLEDEFAPMALAVMVITTIAWMAMLKKARKFKYHTKLGLEASRYMDGLKMYIEMAETERLKLLQSVEGADVSSAGVVKLYEKLLPYAAVFGLEESWMNELAQYCEVEQLAEPDWITTGVTMSEISRMTRSAAGYAAASTVMPSSSGGSISGGGGWSSSSSGGGGGGFSGGGGGGGGFSGR